MHPLDEPRPGWNRRTSQSHHHRCFHDSTSSRLRTSWLFLFLLAFPCALLTDLLTASPVPLVHALKTEVRIDATEEEFPVVLATGAAISTPAPRPSPEGTLLVSTLDGTLHALDLRSGEYLWSFGAGSSLLHSSFEEKDATSAQQQQAKDRTRRTENDLEITRQQQQQQLEEQRRMEDGYDYEDETYDADGSPSNTIHSALLTPHEQLEADLHRDLSSGDLIFDQDEEEHTGHPHPERSRTAGGGRPMHRRSTGAQNGSSSPLMIPGVDGSLFYSGTHGLQRLPINVAELVEAAPFKTGDNTRYLGFKETNVFLIHRNTGALKRVFSPMHTHAFSLNEDCGEASSSSSSTADGGGCDPNLIWVAKTDLTVHAIDGRSRKLRWNVSISTYAPFDNTEGHGVGEWTDAELTEKGYPEIGVSVGGTVHAIDIVKQRVLWSQPLHSPVTSVFLVRPEEIPSADDDGSDGTSSSSDPPPSYTGDMIKLPHFYFDLDPDTPSTGSQGQDTLQAIVAHYHKARDLSQVTQFTYIGQTRQGLIYALPNPQPLSESSGGGYAVEGFGGGHGKGGGIRQWTKQDRPAISSSQAGGTGGSSGAIVLSNTHSTAGKVSYVSKQDVSIAGSDDPALADIPTTSSSSSSTSDCLPTSSRYPRCLIGFHPIDLRSGSETTPSSTTGENGGNQRLIDVSRDFYNQSVRPYDPTTTKGGNPATGSSGDDRNAVVVAKDDRSSSATGSTTKPKRPIRDQDYDDSNDSLIGDHHHDGIRLPREHHTRPFDPRPQQPQLLLPSPSLSFLQTLAVWWPLLATTIVVSVVTVWIMQRTMDRQRGSNNGSASGGGGGGKGKGKGKNRNNGGGSRSAAVIEATTEDDTVTEGDEKDDGGGGAPGEKGQSLTIAQKRRNKKELLRGAFVRQTSEPSPVPSGSPVLTSSPPVMSASPSTSGSLVQRRTHFSTYDLDALAPLPSATSNLLGVPAAGGSANSTATGGLTSVNGSNSGQSGESKAIRPRKHIQSRPDTQKLNSDAVSSSQSPQLNRVFTQAQANPDGSVTIGSMVLFPHQVLGTGSMGTVVYAGTFGGRPCAIKRLVKPFFGSLNAAQEISLLIQSDQHPNVLRYYAKEEDTSFIYLALELCAGTIQDLIEEDAASADDLAGEPKWPQETVKTILYGMMTGLAHLHSLHIVHRDLKPMNSTCMRHEGGVRACVRCERIYLCCMVTCCVLVFASLQSSSPSKVVSACPTWVSESNSP